MYEHAKCNKNMIFFSRFKVITARHCDIKAFAFSIITNKCITEYDNQDEPGHEEVVEVGKKRQFILAELVRRLINHIEMEEK